MIEIIRDKKRWDGLIEYGNFADFYHYYDYHFLSKVKNEDPILIHYHDNEKSVLFPLIIRKIEGTSYKDATSVYGYPGPINMNIPLGYDYSSFHNELKEFFNENDIVSVFSRLNSFDTNQDNCLIGLGHSELLGRVVYIDLTQSLDDQWKQYHRRLRTYINKERGIYSLRNVSDSHDLECLKNLYHENMRRVGAKKEYFFDMKYFNELINSNNFETELILAIDNSTGEIASGAIFTKKNSMVQYHLSGTSHKYLELNPVKLLIDEMRIRATSQGFKKLNLGGGVGSKEDSLFYFKAGFSKLSVPFKVWKYIVNNKVYNDLVKEVNGVPCSKEMKQFFPLYRLKEVI